MKPLTPKKPAKSQRERLILFGLIDLYLKTGKPIGSHTLREQGFEALSPATIRNYFMKLEEEGYLKQQHSSGGRIPTSLAFKIYAEAHINKPRLSEQDKKNATRLFQKQTRELVVYLNQVTESLSELTNCAVFLSAPRFDQDFILDIKLVSIDQSRLLCVLISDFGLIHNEVLYIDKKISHLLLRKLESYFNWRLNKLDKPLLSQEEESLAAKLYKEAILRHIVSYTNFSVEDLFQAGFSRLLAYPDFNDASVLASGLSLFENKQELRALLNKSCQIGKLHSWIGDDLHTFAPEATSCSVLAVPYHIHHTICGAFGLLGPNRIPYRELFGLLEIAANIISDSLTSSMYKYKISFRQPKHSHLESKENPLILEKSSYLLLENKSLYQKGEIDDSRTK